MFINTYSGGKFDPEDLENSDFRLDDIAHSLSLQCRFAGHIPRFYSVAEHSVLVSKNTEYPLEGLLHDASEAYLMDIPTPIKKSKIMNGYIELEDKVMKIIFENFGLEYPFKDDVHNSDRRTLRKEAEYFGLLNPSWDVYLLKNINDPILCMLSEQAEKYFLRRFRELV